MSWVYILECKDASFYTGWTTELAKRFNTHQAGRGSKYTRARLPVKLIWAKWFSTEREARSVEAILKRMSRTMKLEIIAGNPVFEPWGKTLAGIFVQQDHDRQSSKKLLGVDLGKKDKSVGVVGRRIKGQSVEVIVIDDVFELEGK